MVTLGAGGLRCCIGDIIYPLCVLVSGGAGRGLLWFLLEKGREEGGLLEDVVDPAEPDVEGR